MENTNKNSCSDKNMTLLLAPCQVLCFLAMFFCVPTNAQMPQSGSMKQWNVVMITIDAVDPARLGCYGGKKYVTPYLDHIAENGIVIEHAYCTTGSTAPSHASMLTSLYPEKHGCAYNGLPIKNGLWHFPNALLEAGYDTIAWTWAFFMTKKRNFFNGFKYFYTLPNPKPEDYTYSNSDDFKSFKKLYSQHEINSPFFAWIHIIGGHAPLVPIDKKHMQQVKLDGDSQKLPEQKNPNLKPYNDREYLKTLGLYYEANLNEMDETIKAIVDFFNSRFPEKTLFVICADHGESFDHGIVGQHASSPYESTMKIPLLLYSNSPSFPKGVRIKDRIVTTMDIGPTILNLLGLGDAIPYWIDGTDFLQNKHKRDSFCGAGSMIYQFEQEILELNASYILTPEAVTVDETISSIGKMVQESNSFYVYYLLSQTKKSLWKLIYIPLYPINDFGKYVELQLYDAAKDKKEVKNFAVSRRKKELTSQMMLRLVENKPSASYFNNFAIPDMSKNNPKKYFDKYKTQTDDNSHLKKLMDEKTIEGLKSLGYIN